MRRRGSRSANMLKPTVAVVQGQQHASSGGRDTRRASAPSLYGTTNGELQQPQAQNRQAVAHQPQNNINMQWQNQPQQASGQRQLADSWHSFATSMDLTSSSSIAQSNGSSNASQPLQSSLFRSSSHHTSHTAAAGDLLTMSRRSLAPSQPQPNSNPVFAKKRSATVAVAGNDSTNTQTISTSMVGDSSTCQLSVMNMNGRSPQIGQHHHASYANSQHQVHAQRGSITIGQVEGTLPISHDGFHNNQPCSAFEAAVNVSSSTVGAVVNKEDSYQHHRTIRRCRRSDSFEMMEDG